MNPLATQQLAEDHYQAIVRLATAEHAARRMRRARRTSPWRQAVGQALVTVGVGVGVPPQRRPRVLRQARGLLACDDC